MIIGNGMIANAFSFLEKDNSVLIFASGVSNSCETSSVAFGKEKKLLINAINKHLDKIIVYFSTCSIFDQGMQNSAYTNHKIKMENLIKSKSANYIIFRLPQVIGRGGNKSNLINYLYDRINSFVPISIWSDAYRDIIDIEDVVKIVMFTLKDKCIATEINIGSNKPTKVLDIVNIIENLIDKKAIISIIEKESYANGFDISKMQQISKKINIDFNNNYTEKVIGKYYDKK
ncbi:MAG: NAD-dependent epimerase/dehydratase family protein [Sulfuricurvum sp.]|uniref:NAD-dependent epimerase/dehydratase family protein n=1 Tax=Sulfuricurvum sp. TaxID=2025608 RepID=UPI0025E5CEC5|nr:NAD-dependent epimerase/dehydratase family protein [Sulfuricurvum sp.]MBV5320169.1 NAD-dependent epimerase/dehydratase family protein [Sulfuricurvum sp.]